MIAGEGIGKHFGGVTALEDASFTAEAGEIHALVGENGAGKSTMIKILSGVLRPDAGTLRIDGDEVRLRSPEDALARGVATVFQELTLLPGMTVAENLLLGREPRGRFGLIRRRALNGAAARYTVAPPSISCATMPSAAAESVSNAYTGLPAPVSVP